MGRPKKGEGDRRKKAFLIKTPSKRVQKWREAWLIDNFSEICMTIAEGGSLITIAKGAKIPYAVLIHTIFADRKRELVYEKAMESRTEWMVQRVLDEVKRIGTVDIRRAFDSKGNLLKVHKMPEDVARAIQGIEFIDSRIGEPKVKVKFADKIKALELLGRQVDMFTTKVDIGGSISLEKLVEEAATKRTVAPPERGELKPSEN